MSIGHLRYHRKSREEVYRFLGMGDTPKILARKLKPVNHFHTIPYGGGISVDGSQVYIDQDLYREVMSGIIRVRGMSPSQLIGRWIEHEHVEKTIADGDNPIDTYPPAHEIATDKEEEGVEDIGRAPDVYESEIKPALQRCLKRALNLIGSKRFNPPIELWCGPYLDDPTADDRRLLAAFRAHGVIDAFKASKEAAGYGIGAEECRDCAHLEGQCGAVKALHLCSEVAGLVRVDRHCRWWQASKKG
jgi:hypothetical protein